MVSGIYVIIAQVLINSFLKCFGLKLFNRRCDVCLRGHARDSCHCSEPKPFVHFHLMA
jgi:hypothetical protein